jgi:DNA-binding transcriptional MerR regulator
MRIGELARRSGVSVRMLRYYGSHGRPSGYREFQPQDMQIVQRIRLLNAAGFTLAAIRRILPCARGPSARLRALRRISGKPDAPSGRDRPAHGGAARQPAHPRRLSRHGWNIEQGRRGDL